MAKESNASRLPMPGLSRIPLPGLIRPPSNSLAKTSHLRPPTTFAKVRPISYAGLKPATTHQALSIRKSNSGDRLNTLTSTVNMVSKKTTTVFRKFFPKSEQTAVKNNGAGEVTTKPQYDSPRPTLTRSETFVRTESSENLNGTLMPVIGDTAKSGGVLCESTPLLSPNAKRNLYMTQNLDSTFTSNADGKRKHILESTRLSNIGFSNTMDLDSAKQKQHISDGSFGKTIDIETPNNLTKIVHTANYQEETKDVIQTHQTFTKTPKKTDLTHNLESTEVLGRTLYVVTNQTELTKDNVTRLLDSSRLEDKLKCVGLPHTIESNTKLIEYSDINSPATNATYSNPGSSENLLMIDDVSIPSGFEEDVALDVQKQFETLNHQQKFLEITAENLDDTLTALAPDKTSMNLPLNSTMNTERLLELTENMNTPPKHMQSLNLTKDYMDTPNVKNSTQLLYMTQISASCTTTPDRTACKKLSDAMYQLTPIPAHLQSPMLLKGAQSDLVLPIRTPDEDVQQEPIDMDTTLVTAGARTESFYQQTQATSSLQDVNNPSRKSRFSFGLDLTESTLDCSIELVDVSLSSTVLSQPSNNNCNKSQNLSHSISTQQMQHQYLKKQNSFDMDESLGILTPDQMKEFLDSTATNNTNKLDLPLLLNNSNNVNNLSHKLALQQMRIDQTPSPEELPLDPVEVKTDINDMVLQHQQLQTQQQQQLNSQNQVTFSTEDQHQQNLESLSLHTDTEMSKTDTINKSISSSVSKISTSFITSVTSVTSLDTGYQGDGEMSRPASRGPCDHSPSNGPVRKGVSRQPSFNQQQAVVGGHLPPVRRQDPMTDSDFFTESDADDVFNRGDRRAQVIDGQLYGPMLQSAASVFISEDPQMEDSCMESSGIFTDVENRGDEDLAQIRRQDTNETANDLSPDNDLDGEDSTETVRSNRDSMNKKMQSLSQNSDKSAIAVSSSGGSSVMSTTFNSTTTCHGQGHLSSSQTSSTIQSSMSTDRLTADTLSNRTSYCSVNGSNINVNTIGVDFKSFSSLDESFNGEHTHSRMNDVDDCDEDVSYRPVKLTKSSTTSTTSWCEQPMQKHLIAVQKQTSPRKHSSLTSLVTENGVHNKTKTNANTNTLANQNKTSLLHKQSDQESLHSETVSVSGTGSKSSLNESFKSSSKNYTPPKGTTSGGNQYTPRYKTYTPKSAKLRSSSSNQLNTNKNNNNSSSPPVVRKHHYTPNKWDAVMNQIAHNKTVIRTNYNDVKSKVSTRMTTTTTATSSLSNSGAVNGATTNRRASGSPASVSPTQRRSPISNLSKIRNISPSVGSKVSKSTAPTTPTSKSPSPITAAIFSRNKNLDNNASSTKRVLQNSHINRGRSYSKDSQKSSQSDLSLASVGGGGGGGVNNAGVISAESPKSLAKTPMRAAKKRDVRNLSISPTDLGPPPKTQQTANGSSNRPKPSIITLTQKRCTANTNSSASPSTTSTAASTPTGGGSVTSVKGSPPPKKFSLHGKRSDAKTSNITNSKAPLKAQNLNASSSTSTSSLFLSNSPTTSATSTDVVKPALTATFSQTASATLEMLKNHKNSKLPKFHLNDYQAAPVNDVKFSRNITLTSLKTPRQKGIILSANNGARGGGGGSGENSDSVGGKSGRKNKNITLHSSSASLHKLHSSSSASLAAVQTATNAKSTAAASTTATLDATLVSTTSLKTANEMDLLKAAPGLRKKSSFLWNSFRLPRKQKGGGGSGGESRD